MPDRKKNALPEPPARTQTAPGQKASEEAAPGATGPDANVMGIRKGGGPDEYGGSFAGGQSGGGPYASPPGGVTRHAPQPGYHGGGQAGARNSGDNDHHAASRQGRDNDTTYEDHVSQKGGAARARFDAHVEGKAGAQKANGRETVSPDGACIVPMEE